jgi:hypothetical protein
MKSIEYAPQEEKENKNISTKISRLLDGPPSDNYNLRQIQLVAERIIKEHSEFPLNDEYMNDAMMKWADSPWSKAFGGIAHDLQFETHPRFQGNVKNILLEDVQYFIENNKMPLK